jgi:hypothetical protein
MDIVMTPPKGEIIQKKRNVVLTGSGTIMEITNKTAREKKRLGEATPLKILVDTAGSWYVFGLRLGVICAHRALKLLVDSIHQEYTCWNISSIGGPQARGDHFIT